MPVHSSFFNTIFGRNLIDELRHIAHRPYLVVTMADLWPRFAPLVDENLAAVHFVETLEHDMLAHAVDQLPAGNAVIGLGGGQAIDVAKFVAWRRRLPLFQAPTSLTVDAPWGHRAAIRFGGHVRYIGWAAPEAVYVDYDVIQSAPALLNRSGIGDILCYHTAHFDWRLAHERGQVEAHWPYDEELAREAQAVLDQVWARLPDIYAVNEAGIRALANGLRYGGGTYHAAGWNPRHVEGVEHLFFYALEYLTGKKFIHGQPVCLGVYLGSLMQENRAEEMLAAIHRAGVEIRPQAMGVTWDEVAAALHRLRRYVAENGLWYTVANEFDVTDAFVTHARTRVEAVFG